MQRMQMKRERHICTEIKAGREEKWQCWKSKIQSSWMRDRSIWRDWAEGEVQRQEGRSTKRRKQKPIGKGERQIQWNTAAPLPFFAPFASLGMSRSISTPGQILSVVINLKKWANSNKKMGLYKREPVDGKKNHFHPLSFSHFILLLFIHPAPPLKRGQVFIFMK